MKSVMQKLLNVLLLVTIADITSGDDITTIPNTGGNFDTDDPKLLLSTTEANRMFYNISVGYYDNAVAIAQDLFKRGEKSPIRNTVDSLIEYHRSSVVAFAYKLFAAGEKEIVEDLFPASFRMVFNGSLIKFTSNKYNIPIEFSRFEDTDGDKNVYGKEWDAKSNNYIWKLVPELDGNQVYFKIRHFSDNWYLKLGKDMDSDGDYQAFGSRNSDTARHDWMLQPVNYNEAVSFFILNREHYQVLKLAVRSYQGNRKVYSTGGDYYNDPERYSWRVDVVAEPKS